MIDHEKIKQQAKKIMDDFMLALDKVRDVGEKFGFERLHETREDKTSKKEPKDFNDLQFRKIMFENAPKTKDDCIQAEKKKW